MKTITLFLSITLFCNMLHSQKKEKTYWYGTSVEVSKEDLSQTDLTTKCIDTSSEQKSLVTSIVSNLVIPYAIKNVSKLFYNPKKFIKTHSKSLKLYDRKDFSNFENIKCLNYEKKRGSNKLISLNFSLINTTLNRETYKIINLESLKYKYTNVKLKSKHHKVNIVAEITVNYFNNNGNFVNLKLTPFILSGYTPKGEKSITNTFKNVSRIIPANIAVTSIEIKVTEVNDRKKDWDKFLKLFNDNKDKAQSYIIDNFVKN